MGAAACDKTSQVPCRTKIVSREISLNHIVLRDVLECTLRFVSNLLHFLHGASTHELRNHWTYDVFARRAARRALRTYTNAAPRGCVTLRDVHNTHCVMPEVSGERPGGGLKTENCKRQEPKNQESSKRKWRLGASDATPGGEQKATQERKDPRPKIQTNLNIQNQNGKRQTANGKPVRRIRKGCSMKNDRCR